MIANMHVLCYCDRPRVEDGVLVVQPLGIPSYVVLRLASAVGSLHTYTLTHRDARARERASALRLASKQTCTHARMLRYLRTALAA